MVNPFPIQFLALFAYFLLRVFVGIILIYLSGRHLTCRGSLQLNWQSWLPVPAVAVWVLIVFELIVGALILVGAHTQYAALALMLYSVTLFGLHRTPMHHSIPPRIFYTLLFGVALTLFVTGAGALAFDLPL